VNVLSLRHLEPPHKFSGRKDSEGGDEIVTKIGLPRPFLLRRRSESGWQSTLRDMPAPKAND
jgi:hypothetical protein